LLCPGKPLKNFLTNPGFEEPPVDPKKEAAKDWNIYQNRMVNATCFRDTTVKRSGQASLSAKGITDCTGAIRLVTVPNNTRYRVSFWYKTGPETRHGEITIMRIPPIQNEYFPPAADWTRYEKVFTVTNPGGPQARFYLILELRHGGTENSQIWFDDVALEMLAPEGVESP
jgi:hypothetical protein